MRAVFHLGANSSTTETDASLLARNNYRFTMDLWHWCAAEGVPLIYASSAATYGGGSKPGSMMTEAIRGASRKLTPLNPYGWSKHIFDRKHGGDAPATENAAPAANGQGSSSSTSTDPMSTTRAASGASSPPDL